MRRNEVGGRIGGEEFAIILANTDAAAAWHFAEGLCRRMAEREIRLHGLSPTVSISVGLAALDAADANGGAALVRADAAMYRAKGAGRNRVVSD